VLNFKRISAVLAVILCNRGTPTLLGVVSSSLKFLFALRRKGAIVRTIVSLHIVSGGSHYTIVFLNLPLGKAYPEYIELLAQVTSMQTAPGLNGCCVTAQGLAQSPEQLMEAILEGLGGTKALGGSSGQTYINLQEEVYVRGMQDTQYWNGV
jgi:hypothetical protein